MSGYLLTAYACLTAALAAITGGVVLARADHWLAFGLLLWLAIILLVVGVVCRRGHYKPNTEGQA
ncbi:hypothetical protein [Streptomyces sp. NPDC093269]|uniref:hypothetical protein n=1 Tax=Streptomyces sp. NPDC093269 TaxID=3366038 RepID=UPI003820D4F2